MAYKIAFFGAKPYDIASFRKTKRFAGESCGKKHLSVSQERLKCFRQKT